MENHRVCPHCGSHNNPGFEKCWNCAYSFADGKISDIPLIRGSKRGKASKTLDFLAIALIALFSIPFLTARVPLPNKDPGLYEDTVGGMFMLLSIRRAQLSYQENVGKGGDKWLPILSNEDKAAWGKIGLVPPDPKNRFTYICTSDECTAWLSKSWKAVNYKDYMRLERDDTWDCSGIFKPRSKEINGGTDGCTAGERQRYIPLLIKIGIAGLFIAFVLSVNYFYSRRCSSSKGQSKG